MDGSGHNEVWGMNNKQLSSNIQPNLLAIDEVAKFLGISKDTIYKMVNQRRIPYVKFRRLLRFELDALDSWIRQHAEMPMSFKRSWPVELLKQEKGRKLFVAVEPLSFEEVIWEMVVSEIIHI